MKLHQANMTECPQCKECMKELHKMSLMLIAEQQKAELYRQILEQKFVINISTDHSKVDELISSVNSRFFGGSEIKQQPQQTIPTIQPQNTLISTKKKQFKAAPKGFEMADESSLPQNDSRIIDAKIHDENIELFGNYDMEINKDLFDENIKQLRIYKNTKDGTAVLSNIKKQRQIFQLSMSPSEYSTFLVEHVETIKNSIMENTNIEKKPKMSLLLSKILTSLEQRIIFHAGFQSQILDVDEIQKFERCLKLSAKYPKTFRSFSSKSMCEYFTNYSLALFPVSKMFEMYVDNPYGFKNIIFVPFENDFAFYHLEKYDDSTKTRFWVLDSRLETLTYELRDTIRDYCVMLFRKIYKQCLGSNDYNETYKTKYNVLEFDCEQLLQNIITTIDFKEFNKKLTDVVKTHCLYTPTANDKFNSYTDSEDQIRSFKRYKVEDSEITATIGSMFDKIKESQCFEIYKKN